jgi:hypothetical protein
MDCCVNKKVHLEDWMPLIRETLAAGKNVEFSPRGTSMLPMLRQGMDRVVLSPLPEKLQKYDLPLYQRENGQYVLHRIVKVGETITCIGDNQIDREEGLLESQMIGLVTAFYRGNKKISVTDWRYGLYCRIWPVSRPARRAWRWLKSKLRRH